MKAAYIQQFGGPEVLQNGDHPDPSAGPGQIVVDTFAASVNGADWKVHAGSYGQAKFLLILGATSPARSARSAPDRCLDGHLAQRESVPFTRERS
jgi:hypothetical protein